MSLPPESMTFQGDESATSALRPVFDASVAMVILNTLFFSLRYIARLWIKRVPLGWDDLMVCGSYLANLAICGVGLGMYYLETRGNPPAHAPLALSLHQIETQLKPALKCQYAIAQLNFIGHALPKLSLLFLYLRVFSLNRAFRWSTYVVMAFVILPAVVYSLVSFFSCKPVAYFWDKTIIGGHCLSYDAFYRWGQGVNTFEDIAVLVLPIYPLWRLQAPTSKKLGYSVVFSVSALGLIAGIVKWVNFLLYTSEMISPFLTSKLITWVVVEAGMYLIACSLAGCGPLYTASVKMVKSYSSTIGTSYGRSRGASDSLGFARLGEAEASGRDFSKSAHAHANSTELENMSEQIVVKTDVTVESTRGGRRTPMTRALSEA